MILGSRVRKHIYHEPASFSISLIITLVYPLHLS